MKELVIYVVFFIGTPLSVLSQSKPVPSTQTNKSEPIVSTSVYRINGITEINNLYIIQIFKNGLLVRVISPKTETVNCTSLLVSNNYYKLTLVELFPTDVMGTQITYHEAFGIRFTLVPGENVYVARNLKGLCIE